MTKKKHKSDTERIVANCIAGFHKINFRIALKALREARSQFAQVAKAVEHIASEPDFASVADAIDVTHAIEVLDELIATTEASIPESRAKRAARKWSEGFRRELDEEIRSRTVVKEVT